VDKLWIVLPFGRKRQKTPCALLRDKVLDLQVKIAISIFLEGSKGMKNPYKVFHSTQDLWREKVHVVLVRPEIGGNVGSAARALANMGIWGSFDIVGDRTILDGSAFQMAKHAKERLDQIRFFPSLEEALKAPLPSQVEPRTQAPTTSARQLILAATARVGSAHRPHPLWVRTAMQRAVGKLAASEITDIKIVFGPESDGLSNEEVELCDWVVTIPSSSEYRSLNLAQAILIFSYEVNMNLVQEWQPQRGPRLSQRNRLIAHILQLAEEVGFILPSDPYKMRPRLEEILSRLPNHIPEIRTLHGLLDQAIRTVKRGRVDLKGRFKKHATVERGV
jgi:TrmH family RNA methyltransferase